MSGKSPQNSAGERTTTIANLVKHRNLQGFSEELWVNATPDWLKTVWADWDSALYKIGSKANSSGDDIRLLK